MAAIKDFPYFINERESIRLKLQHHLYKSLELIGCKPYAPCRTHSCNISKGLFNNNYYIWIIAQNQITQ